MLEKTAVSLLGREPGVTTWGGREPEEKYSWVERHRFHPQRPSSSHDEPSRTVARQGQAAGHKGLSNNVWKKTDILCTNLTWNRFLSSLLVALPAEGRGLAGGFQGGLVCAHT